MRAIVIDDDRDMRASLAGLLEAAGWQCRALARAEDLAAAEAEITPHVIVSDVCMPGLSGADLLDGRAKTAAPIVLISAHGDIPMAVDAMQRGAFSFLEKPFDPRRLLNMLVHAAEKFQLQADATRLRARLAKLSGLDRVLVGRGAAIARIREDLMDLSATDANLLLLGETGTGKALAARAVHDLGPRSGGAFVPVDCGALSSERAEAILFGAGTGSGADAGALRGLVPQAEGGTLFLDEIGDCPPETQLRLLRLLEERDASPTAGPAPRRALFRVIAASTRDLGAEVEAGRFRADLLFRLNTFEVTLPPLRGRSEDLQMIFQHCLEEAARLYETTPPALTPEDLATLLAHDWPGNAREIRNVAERRVLAARRGRGSVAEAIRRDAAAEIPDTLREAVAAFERQLIGRAIAAHRGRMDAVAEALGIGRRTLNEKIVKLGLNKEEFL